MKAETSGTMTYGDIAGVPVPVSRLVFGAAIGPMMRDEDAFELLDAVFASGITTFDTAASYGDSEASLGRWIAARGVRDRVVVLTKGANTTRWRTRLTPHDILSDFETSLAKLQTDCVDIFLLHRDDPKVSVGPIVELLNELHSAGRMRVFGVSNWTVDRLEQANEYAYRHSLVPFRVASPAYSLAEMIADPVGGSVTLSGERNRAEREWYAANRTPVFAYSSLARGFFSGRVRSVDTGRAAELIGLGGQEYGFPVNYERLRRAETLAADRGVTVAQVALAWLLHEPLNLYAVTSPSSVEHLRESVAAVGLELTDQACAWLNLDADEAG